MTKPNHAKSDENQQIAVYKNYMKEIEFMHQFLEDSEIFVPTSPKFKTFLIQSFAQLHSDFHYLSFLNNEETDQELVRASEILQILPVNSIKEGEKLFGDMKKEDVNKFWIRFFTLFKMEKSDFNINSMNDLNWENKIEFLKNMSSTLHYLNYDFSVVNTKKLKNVNFDKEIEKWNETMYSNDKAVNKSTFCNFEMEGLDDTLIEKLMVDLKQITTMFKDLEQINQKTEFEYKDFFNEFVQLTKNILKYKSNLNIIDSSFLEDLCNKVCSQGTTDLTADIYFIKRCNNIIKVLKSKLKMLNQVS